MWPVLQKKKKEKKKDVVAFYNNKGNEGLTLTNNRAMLW